MDLQLSGMRAFISGSTGGIGFAVARALLREGAEVVVNGRMPERVDEAVRRLEGDVPGARVSGVPADFSDAASVEGLIGALGPVDILVNNVGLFEMTPFGEIADADWARYIEVNLMSGVRLSRALLPDMIANGWGRIVFVASESGVDVPAEMTHYGVTKAGMIALGNGLAKLTRGTAVTVNTVLGGPTYSDGVAATIRELASERGMPVEEVKAAIIGAHPTTLLERFIEPDEIANLVAYLSSPLASATNGSAVRADGGVLTTML